MMEVKEMLSNFRLLKGTENASQRRGLLPRPQLCSIYFLDLIGFLPRHKCEDLRLMSRRLSNDLAVYPRSEIPKRILKKVEIYSEVSQRVFEGANEEAIIHASRIEEPRWQILDFAWELLRWRSIGFKWRSGSGHGSELIDSIRDQWLEVGSCGSLFSLHPS